MTPEKKPRKSIMRVSSASGSGGKPPKHKSNSSTATPSSLNTPEKNDQMRLRKTNSGVIVPPLDYLQLN